MVEKKRVVFTNNSNKELYLKGQCYWSGTPVMIPSRIPPRSTATGKLQADANGSLKFGTVYNDSEAEVDTTCKFISAFDIIPPRHHDFSIKIGEDESMREVIVRHGFIVDAIGFVIADDKTGTTSMKLFGGDQGTEERIILEPGREYITQISGTYGKYAHSDSNVVVATLYIDTNIKQYGPFGKGELVQNPHDFSSTKGNVIGFYGRHSNYLESIGVYNTTSPPSMEYGPYGSQLPRNYSLKIGQDESIKEIIVRHSEVVDAIGFVTADKTGITSTKMFGANGGYLEKISLGSDEYITQISGKYRKYFEFPEVVNRLTICTNLNPTGYGPFGKETSLPQHNQRDFESVKGQVVGVFGKYDKFVESIGLFLSTGAGAGPGPGPGNDTKAYAESGAVSFPTNWEVVNVRLGQSKSTHICVDYKLGSKVEATVSNNGMMVIIDN